MPNYVNAITGKSHQLNDQALALAKAAKTVITEDAYLFRRFAELVIGPGIRPTAEAFARYFSVINPTTGRIYEVPGEKSAAARMDYSTTVEIELDGTEDLVDLRFGPNGVSNKSSGPLLSKYIREGYVVPRIFFNLQQKVNANIKEYMEYVESNKITLTHLNDSLTKLKRKYKEADGIENVEERETQLKKIKFSKELSAFANMRIAAGENCLRDSQSVEQTVQIDLDSNPNTSDSNPRSDDQRFYAFFEARNKARNLSSKKPLSNDQSFQSNLQVDDQTLDAADLLLSMRVI